MKFLADKGVDVPMSALNVLIRYPNEYVDGFPSRGGGCIIGETVKKKGEEVWQEVKMGVITFEVAESQVVEWVQQLSPVAKQSVLRALIPRLDELEALVDYGGQRARALCAERGLDWDNLTEDGRQQLIDELLHEA